MAHPRRWLLGLWLAVAGCASPHSAAHLTSAKIHLASTQANPAEARQVPDLFVGCFDANSCPSAVGMLVVDDGQHEPERCTATLISHDRALTAVHCLASAERYAGAPCQTTWLAFPATAAAPAEWAACARVLVASGVVDENGLHQEHAVLQLARHVERAPLAIDPRPIEPNSIVEVVSITPHPIYGSTHELTTRLCRAIDSQPAVDALGVRAQQVGWLQNCPIARGNSGSPVLDRDGRIRAMVHGGTATTFELAVTSGL